jgi:hypothetical protein
MRGATVRQGYNSARSRARTLAVVLLGVPLGLIFPAGATAAAPEPFRSVPGTDHSCAPENGVLFCEGESIDDRIPSFEGAPLDVDVTLPAGYEAGDGPLPTLVMLHGYGGDKTDFESDSPGGGDPDSATIYRYNNNFYAKQGYAVLNYTARGFGRSCGAAENSFASSDCAPPTRGYIHLADQRWEARDTQYLLGLLVDEGIVDPDAVGVTGISYGGGQSIELAYLRDRIRTLGGDFRRWRSPDGAGLEISAAYPRWPWSDLVSSLLPNGRFLDSRVSPKGESRNPIGVPKETYIDGLFALGLEAGTYCGEPPYTPCTDDTADLSAWNARIQAGEPPTQDARAIANEVYKFHQGYGIEPSRAGVAPLLLESGWTDDLFPPKETIRVYNSLRADDPDASVSLQLGDLGHARGSNKENADRAFNSAAADFFELELEGPASAGDSSAAAAPKAGSVTAYTQTCPQDEPAGGPFRARAYDRLNGGVLRVSGSGSDTVTSTGGDPATGAAIDPIAGGGDACREVPEENVPGTAVVEGPVSRGFTLLGLPSVTARIDTTGPFGQLDSRLWDVAPDGQQILVSRGAYRLENGQSGQVEFRLHGNGYCFAEGHVPKLELVGSDAPFLRPSNGAFAIDVSNVELRLPTAEADPVPRLDLSVRPGRTRVGEPTRFRFAVTSRPPRCAESSRSRADRSVPVEDARVRFGGVTERTNQNGRLSLRGQFSEAGTAIATASKEGYREDRARVRVRAADGEASDPREAGEGGGGGGGGGGGSASSGFTTSGGSTSDGGTTGGDLDCSDVTDEEAEAILEDDPSDPNVLDRDNDRDACEAGAGGEEVTGSGLPFTGLSLGLLLAAGAVLAASGAAIRKRLHAR